MHVVDHSPPHFHAVYEGEEALMDISSGDVISGKMPDRALNLVKDWRKMHQAELEENWNVAKARRELFSIAPLK